MARTIRPARRREGRGIGEILSEYFIYIVALIGIILLARWYFMVHLKSPQTALLGFLGAVKSGNVDKQYDLVAASTKRIWPTKRDYDRQCPLAHGLSGRLAEYTITKMTDSGDKAEADVTLSVRKEGQELYQAGADKFKDKYVLARESGEWKVALDASVVNSAPSGFGR
jgi:hypothetical protein